jgi:hypothetical protein
MSSKNVHVVISDLDNHSILNVETSSFEGFRRLFEHARAEAWQGGSGEPLFPAEGLFTVFVEYRRSRYCIVSAYDLVYGDDVLRCVAHALDALVRHPDPSKFLPDFPDVYCRVAEARRHRDAALVVA